ncbi:PREDICTED: corticosteroid 11-beta-dehydrogenase isozyme 2 [Nanorana parkeri]|uniref:corticosteroid 11-beta-dehydrogenase isozyme 2 n=1 Tax=Nanorana parkeri TaxID=125878 RepID=UPI0008541789|nr:PREDICTED: corticosteroid 11-beta-dehydrogenase isozyme 2 [Nanorana parkeri]
MFVNVGVCVCVCMSAVLLDFVHNFCSPNSAHLCSLPSACLAAMELSTSPSLWAYGSVLLIFSLLVYLKCSHSDMVLTPALLVYFFLLVLFEWFCHLYLPIFLGMVLLSLACCYVLSIVSPKKMLPVAGKAVLITGCDSGFGKASAQRMDEMGFKVIATVLDLNSSGAKDLQKRCSDRLTIIQVDLTKPEDIKRAQQVAKEQTHETGLWALVNNAGYCAHFGDAELSLMSTYRGCMEVNFFGTLEITKALLPMLRSSKGRIVTVSSPAGEHSFPFLAAYGSSKAALSRVMDTFRHELSPWGVKVSVIQPASYKTGAHDDKNHWENQHKKLLSNLPSELLQEYGEEYISETQNLFLEYGKTASTDLSPVMDSITDAILSENPKVKYYAGKRLWLLYFIGLYLPHIISDGFYKNLFLKGKTIPRALRKQKSHE